MSELLKNHSIEPVYFYITVGVVALLLVAFTFLIIKLSNLSKANQTATDNFNETNKQLNDELNNLQFKLQNQSQENQFVREQLVKAEHFITEQKQAFETEKQNMQSLISQHQLKLGRLQEQANELSRQQDQNAELRFELDSVKTELLKARSDLEVKTASFTQERKAFEEKLYMLEQAEKKLGEQFENLANRIFESKAKAFTENNEKGITQLVAPLKHQLDDFKRQINEQHIREGKDRASLKSEILSLQALNKQITQEAAALTNALKGDNKQQGNWGELVLERILDESGLRKGHEYETQKSLSNETGKRYQPDVVVHLPNQKDIVIDSKVSLNAYERYVNSDDEQVQKSALKEHIASLKGHIKGLSKKDYQALEGIQTLDYVLMFVPIEAAFICAVENDSSLINLALDNQIMLVSPTNLLVALRTINNIWQYEYQNQNANKIAEQARKLYEKLAGFVTDMDKMGKSLESANTYYDGAMSKLSKGRGNLLSQAEKFKSLGVQPTKNIDGKFLESED